MSDTRPNISLSKTPMLAWNEVPGATSYKFKICIEGTSVPIWEIEITEINPSGFVKKADELLQPPQCWCKDGFCECDYPASQKPLERLKSYILVGEANGATLKKAEIGVLILEEQVETDVKTFEKTLLAPDSSVSDELKQQWFTAREAVSNPFFASIASSGGERRPKWPVFCMVARFQ